MSENTTQDLPLLKVRDLHVYYGAIHAVKGISQIGRASCRERV